jgi:hypothetical protein
LRLYQPGVGHGTARDGHSFHLGLCPLGAYPGTAGGLEWAATALAARRGAIRLGECPWDKRLRLFAIGVRSPTDQRGPWVYVTSLRSLGPQTLARLYRQRWRVEQVIEELVNGHDLDHLVSYRLHPNQVALGFRLLARNLAIGWQIADAQARPAVIREPRAFRAAHVEGLGLFVQESHTITLTSRQSLLQHACYLPWSHLTVEVVA